MAQGFVAKILESGKDSTISIPASASPDEVVEGMYSAVNILKARLVDADKRTAQALKEKEQLIRECSDLKARLAAMGDGSMNKSVLETLKQQTASAERKLAEEEKECKSLEKTIMEERKARGAAEQKIAIAEAQAEAAKQITVNLKSELEYARNELSRLRDNAKSIAKNPRPAPRAVEVTVGERDFRGNIKSLTVSPG